MRQTERVEERAGGIAGALGVAALVAVVLLADLRRGSSSGGYTVRAIFDDAANIIPGENVKIDGVKVGTVGSVDAHAAGRRRRSCWTSKTPGFQDFRADASCTIARRR